MLTVQKIRETKHRPTKKGDINPLTGLMYCADCGAKMFNHRTGGYEKKDKDGNPTGKYTNAQDNYTCSTYSKAKSKFENKCTQHHVRTDVVRDLLLEVIKATSSYVMEHEAEFIKKVRSATELQQESEAKALKKRLSREQKRINELNTLIKKIYEDNVNGKLSDKRFEMLLADYETEQNELELSVEALENSLNEYQENADNVDKFIELVHRYTDFTELTPEQIEEEDRKRRKRAWNRTYMRRKYEREKAEREAKETLDNAYRTYPMLRGAVLHSDRGTQYTSELYRKAINKYGILQNMNSAGGRCHDNARCESMWARFKEELLYGRYDTTSMTVEQLKTLI